MKDILGIGRTDWTMWLFYIAFGMGVLGTSNSFVTLATNSPAAYRPVLIQSGLICAFALGASILFMYLCEIRKFVWGFIPICLSLIGVVNIWSRWDVVFG